MDPITALGAVASVLQLANAALTLSTTIYTLTSALKSAAGDLADLASDLESFSQSLSVLHRLLADGSTWYSDDVYLLTARIIRDCADLYAKIDKVLRKLLPKDGEKWRSGMAARWVLKEKAVKKLLERLRDMKLTLANILMTLNLDLQLGMLGVGNTGGKSQLQREKMRPLREATVERLIEAKRLAEKSLGFANTVEQDWEEPEAESEDEEEILEENNEPEKKDRSTKGKRAESEFDARDVIRPSSSDEKSKALLTPRNLEGVPTTKSRSTSPAASTPSMSKEDMIRSADQSVTFRTAGSHETPRMEPPGPEVLARGLLPSVINPVIVPTPTPIPVMNFIAHPSDAEAFEKKSAIAPPTSILQNSKLMAFGAFVGAFGAVFPTAIERVDDQNNERGSVARSLHNTSSTDSFASAKSKLSRKELHGARSETQKDGEFNATVSKPTGPDMTKLVLEPEVTQLINSFRRALRVAENVLNQDPRRITDARKRDVTKLKESLSCGIEEVDQAFRFGYELHGQHFLRGFRIDETVRVALNCASLEIHDISYELERVLEKDFEMIFFAPTVLVSKSDRCRQDCVDALSRLENDTGQVKALLEQSTSKTGTQRGSGLRRGNYEGYHPTPSRSLPRSGRKYDKSSVPSSGSKQSSSVPWRISASEQDSIGGKKSTFTSKPTTSKTKDSKPKDNKIKETSKLMSTLKFWKGKPYGESKSVVPEAPGVPRRLEAEPILRTDQQYPSMVVSRTSRPSLFTWDESDPERPAQVAPEKGWSSSDIDHVPPRQAFHLVGSTPPQNDSQASPPLPSLPSSTPTEDAFGDTRPATSHLDTLYGFSQRHSLPATAEPKDINNIFASPLMETIHENRFSNVVNAASNSPSNYKSPTRTSRPPDTFPALQRAPVSALRNGVTEAIETIRPGNSPKSLREIRSGYRAPLLFSREEPISPDEEDGDDLFPDVFSDNFKSNRLLPSAPTERISYDEDYEDEYSTPASIIKTPQDIMTDRSANEALLKTPRFIKLKVETDLITIGDIEMPDEATVEDLIKTIDRLGHEIPWNQVGLVYLNQKLAKERRLSSYNIKHGSTIRVRKLTPMEKDVLFTSSESAFDDTVAVPNQGKFGRTSLTINSPSYSILSPTHSSGMIAATFVDPISSPSSSSLPKEPLSLWQQSDVNFQASEPVLHAKLQTALQYLMRRNVGNETQTSRIMSQEDWTKAANISLKILRVMLDANTPKTGTSQEPKDISEKKQDYKDFAAKIYLVADAMANSIGLRLAGKIWTLIARLTPAVFYSHLPQKYRTEFLAHFSSTVGIIARYVVMENLYNSFPGMTLNPYYRTSLLELGLCLMQYLARSTIYWENMNRIQKNLTKEQTRQVGGVEKEKKMKMDLADLSSWAEKIVGFDRLCQDFTVKFDVSNQDEGGGKGKAKEPSLGYVSDETTDEDTDLDSNSQTIQWVGGGIKFRS